MRENRVYSACLHTLSWTQELLQYYCHHSVFGNVTHKYLGPSNTLRQDAIYEPLHPTFFMLQLFCGSICFFPAPPIQLNHVHQCVKLNQACVPVQYNTSLWDLNAW